MTGPRRAKAKGRKFEIRRRGKGSPLRNSRPSGGGARAAEPRAARAAILCLRATARGAREADDARSDARWRAALRQLILDAPKILDVCVLFGHSERNVALVREMAASLLSLQPRYAGDLVECAAKTVEVLGVVAAPAARGKP